jgi:hypothetical protein
LFDQNSVDSLNRRKLFAWSESVCLIRKILLIASDWTQTFWHLGFCWFRLGHINRFYLHWISFAILQDCIMTWYGRTWGSF